MDSQPHLIRAQLLIEQHRWELAEQELRLALVGDPNDSTAHALLALCLNEREQFAAATQEAELAVHLAPDSPFPHYVLAAVLFARNHFPEAERSVREALRLDPFDPDYHGWLAQVCFTQRRWPEALQAAESGLALDGQHVTCANLRAMALVKLGRKDGAGVAIQAALARNPENSDTHANMGWTLLEQNQPGKALEHFRESLRLDPQNEWARHGIVEAMKARFFVYRVMLRFFLWMMKLSQRGQWTVIVGGYIGYQVLRNVARTNETLRPWLQPLLIAYIVFAVMTWLAGPLFNLMLRLNRFGRLALSREEIRTSDFVGLSLLGCVVLVGWSWFGPEYLLLTGLMCGLLSFPLSRIYNCDQGWPRNTLIACTVGLGLIAVGSTAMLVGGEQLLTGEAREVVAGLGVLGFYAYCIAIFVLQFVIAGLVQATVRK